MGRGEPGASSQDRGRTDPQSFEAQKKRRGEVLFLIPVSRPYLMGSDFSEAPTTRSTCSFAAFLVLKP